MANEKKLSKVKIGIPFDDLVEAIREMKDEDREWFVENLLASTSPEYLQSIRDAREDYRQGRVVDSEELFKELP
jgi:hypothetical protein